MARLHEHQGKTLLQAHGIGAPRGVVVRTADEARAAAADIGGPVVLKVQAWITGRKARGGIRFVPAAGTNGGGPRRAAAEAADLLAMSFGSFPVTEVLVEETLDIRDELFVSLSVDDAARAPVLLLDAGGGSGIEERAEHVVRLPVSPSRGLDAGAVEGVLERSGIDAASHAALADAIGRMVDLAREIEARSVEINPLVVTADGRVMAADCRITIDDYAVFRHPELGIEIARELDHPATTLERIAYGVEKDDHRGTFYFAQLPTDDAAASRGLVGFHGAGGGGSMMSMDAVTDAGFTLANFCDTSGNPSAAKVYRAARIILAQPGLVGYFGSGSGVASQEQFHSAYGLAKAFIETGLEIPAVVRLGGNSEDRAVEILEDACRDLPGRVECYKKDDTPAFCAARFAALVEDAPHADALPPGRQRRLPAFVSAPASSSFAITGGRVWIDDARARADPAAAACAVEHASGLLKLDGEGRPVPAVSPDDIAGKDSEFIACEIECHRAGFPVVFVDLALPDLDHTAA